MILFNNQPISNNKFSEEILNHGLSIYEVCRVFRGKVIFLDDNLSRLANSIKKSGVHLDFSTLGVENKLNRLIQLEHIKEGNIKYVLRLTPSGVDEYVYQIPHSYPPEEAYEQGVDTVTLRAMRENAEVKYITSNLRETTNAIIKEKMSTKYYSWMTTTASRKVSAPMCSLSKATPFARPHFPMCCRAPAGNACSPFARRTISP